VAFLAVATPSEPIVAFAVGVGLFALSRPIIRRVAAAENNPWLVKVMTVSVALHLLAAPMQIWVVDHFYGGIADWTRYDSEGAALAVGFRHFDFALGQLHGIVNNGAVSIIAGAVFAIDGTNQLATFFIFSWVAFIGLILFFRAFTLTFAGANHRRYAILLFFLPSLIFWTSDVSKEAIMTFALGLIAYGAAKILARKSGGLLYILPGSVIAAFVRPNELLIAAAALVVAVMIMPSSPLRNQSGLRRLFSFVVLSAVLGVSLYLTFHYLHGKGGSLSLNQISKNNAGTTSGHGSSNVPYSSSPAGFPRDIYTVLFDPLPINAHGHGEILAALENLFIIGVILASFRQLRIVVRASFARPYVMFCAVYTVAFIYTFAALGNLGLITRERTIMLPFLLVILSIPRAPKGEPPRYEWELRRRDRLRLRRSGREQGQPVMAGSARRPDPGYPAPPRPRPRPNGRPGPERGVGPREPGHNGVDGG